MKRTTSLPLLALFIIGLYVLGQNPATSAEAGHLVQEVVNTITASDQGHRLSTAIVPDWKWINVKNPTPVTQRYHDSTRDFGYDDACRIGRGGILIGIMADDNRLLVGYETPHQPVGTECPSGVIFFIEKAEFDSMTEQYHANIAKESRERELVKNLLDDSGQ